LNLRYKIFYLGIQMVLIYYLIKNTFCVLCDFIEIDFGELINP
jgi:hypothetical protein